MKLYKCKLISVVGGKHEVGGLVGHLRLTGEAALTLEGSSKDNYILPDNSEAAITAQSSAGGAFGYFESPKTTAFQQAVRIAVNVTTSEENAGGAIGKINQCQLDLSVFDMTSATMQVSGKSNIGGLVGAAYNSTLTGNTPFNYKAGSNQAYIPDAGSFTPLFKGIVKGHSETGGAVGYAENSTLRAICVEAGVDGTGGDNIGGIVGKCITKGRGNQLEDLVSKSNVTAYSNNIGGICGYFNCNDYSYVTDCINYGNVNAGENVGGIFGYYNRSLYTTYVEDYKATDVRWCVNTGDITANNRVGGIIGLATGRVSTYAYDTSVLVQKCGNTGKITGNSANESKSGVGGIVGYGEEQIRLERNANSGYILSTAGHKGVGGIAGSMGVDAKKDFHTDCLNVEIYYCSNHGTIDSQNKHSRVGGILGFMEEGPNADLRNCANRGSVLHKHDSDNGGIVGYVDHLNNIYYCVNLGQVEHGNATIGTHKSGSIFNHDGLYFLEGTGNGWPSATKVSEGKKCNEDSYKKLDFHDIWEMKSDGPEIRDCPFKPVK